MFTKITTKFRIFTRLVISMLFISVLVVTGCADLQGTEQPGNMEGAVYSSATGLQVAALNVQSDEIAEVLDIERWKFEVTPPASKASLRYSLVLLQPGDEPQTLFSFGVDNEEAGEIDVLVAIYPIDESLYRAEKMKIYVRSGSGSSSAVVDNPFMGFDFSSPSQPAELHNDGSFKLISFSSDGSIPSPDDVLLVFQVRHSSEEMSN